MRKFYLVSAIVVGILILIVSFAQVGASCSLYLFSNSTSVFLVFLQVAGLGAIFGGLLILFWKMPLPNNDEDDTEELPEKKEEKMSTKIEE